MRNGGTRNPYRDMESSTEEMEVGSLVGDVSGGHHLDGGKDPIR